MLHRLYKTQKVAVKIYNLYQKIYDNMTSQIAIQWTSFQNLSFIILEYHIFQKWETCSQYFSVQKKASILMTITNKCLMRTRYINILQCKAFITNFIAHTFKLNIEHDMCIDFCMIHNSISVFLNKKWLPILQKVTGLENNFDRVIIQLEIRM